MALVGGWGDLPVLLLYCLDLGLALALDVEQRVLGRHVDGFGGTVAGVCSVVGCEGGSERRSALTLASWSS